MKLPFNFFDILLAAVLVVGVMRGRKHGLSGELPALMKWLIVVFGCAQIYQPLGSMLAAGGTFDLLSAYLLVYLGSALVILLIFSIMQRKLAPRLTASDVFGRGEYYLGMGSGMVRFGCMAMVVLALLNARAFTPTELKASDRYNEDLYGGNLFPSLHGLQTSVFEGSLAGPWIKSDLAFLLIEPTEVRQTSPKPQSPKPPPGQAQTKR